MKVYINTKNANKCRQTLIQISVLCCVSSTRLTIFFVLSQGTTIIAIITSLAWLSLWWFLQCMKNRAWIRTMHGNLKKVPKFNHSFIWQSQWWYCGSITVMNFLRHRNYMTQLFRKLFRTTLRQNSYLNYRFIKNYQHIIYKTYYSNYFPFKHICVHILCRFCDTGIIMTSLRCFYARDLQNRAEFLQSMIRHLPLRNFACKFRLRNVSHNARYIALKSLDSIYISICVKLG